MPDLPLKPGEPAPWFICRSTSNERYHFNSVAGRYVVLCFFGSAGDADSAAVLSGFQSVRAIFNDADVCFFGVSSDPEDEGLGRARQSLPGMRMFWDFDNGIASLFGVAAPGAALRKCVYVLDARLRVIAYVPFATEGGPVARTLEVLKRMPAFGAEAPAAVQAPVLVVPHVFEPALCRRLIELYELRGGVDSGFMETVDGRTVGKVDHSFKRRRDTPIEDQALRTLCNARLNDRLAPELIKAFQFRATRIERHIVACYDADEGGYFNAHRDNTTPGTAHRRFAVSLFLNAGEYEGGWLRFPEYGRQLHAAPTGGAVVFSCSLLHEATPVTRGKRYMYLPFLFDDAAATEREARLRAAGDGPGAG